MFFISLPSFNKNRNANFALGFLYHEGKYVKQDMHHAISLYKEASPFNHQYAKKNNLGIIYKHGFGELFPVRIGSSIEYFNEAIRHNNNNNKVCMYNLAHLYFYEDPIKDN